MLTRKAKSRPLGKTGVSRTKQEFKDECDVNKIIERFKRTGQLDHISQSMPIFGDFTNVPDYHTASIQIKDAEAAFAAMPSRIRDRMGNQVEKLLDFLDDPENLEESYTLGLRTRPKKPPLAEGEPAPAAPDPPPAPPNGGE